MTRTEVSDWTVYRLANEAGCTDPDSEDSPGAQFLGGIRDSVLEAIEYGGDPEEIPHEVADAAVPVYTYQRWRTFVDLGAWEEDEDLDELGGYPDDMTLAAGHCLYLIGSRLAAAILAELEDEDEDEDD